ncbi:hypothetical protein [Ruegeria meonggei]|uniref:Uncharacterized protein n=1 Tax=Ruegeria meonggei TaxID=1446476 RepID=A0A1X6Z9R8_9RHOB|nr:hypothetical protein [Ruegeria meonggei]SLN44936.1 hypothetical protein RUM8411_02080 [Ruegeria meonggei]
MRKAERATNEDILKFEEKMHRVCSRQTWQYIDPETIKLKPLKRKHLSKKKYFEAIRGEVLEAVELIDSQLNVPGRYSQFGPKNVLKQFVYQLVRKCRSKGREAKLQRFLEDSVRSTGKRTQRNPKHLGAKNLFFHCFRGFDPMERWVRSGEVSKLSRQLLYADVKDVPSKYLIGFIHQTGGKILNEVPIYVSGQTADRDEDADQ